MKVGIGIALAAVGATLAFAVRDGLGSIDLTMAGYILMAAGLLVVLVSVLMANQKRSHVSQTVSTDSAGRQSVQETRTESTPPAPPAI